jgi:CheY-like chemotaxis protein
VEKAPSLLRELAHELRDALSPIRSALDLMRLRGFEPQASQKLGESMERGLERALVTLDAFVLAEQYAAGTVTLECAPVLVRELLARVQDAMAPALRARCVFAQSDPDLQVSADAPRSQLALMSMLENVARIAAVQTPIGVHAVGGPERVGVQVRFTPDARAGERPDVFESYHLHGSSRTALATAGHILKLQRGDLIRQSGPEGSSWVALFRVATAQAAAATEHSATITAVPADSAGLPPDTHRHGRHVLLVDDSGEVRRTYREALVALGYTVTEAEGADAALRATSTALPDIALIDIHLPGMNGYQLARRLRARAGTAVFLVMLSGMTLDEITLRESQAAGFDRCFDKAAGPKALHQLLSGLP